jgi:hypothetical protein
VISLLKNWMFLASVKAEIYAQHKDQGFVDRISQFRPSAMLLLESMRKSPQLQVEARKVRAFLGAGGVLALAIGADDLSQADRDTAAGLLVHRLSKVNADSVFRNFHGLTIGSWDTSLANFSKETEGDNK